MDTNMHVPLLDLKKQLEPIREEIVEAVSEVIDSTNYILGPKVEGLEKDVAAYSGSRHGIGVASGTDALLAALMGLKVGPGDYVLTTPYSFFATMGSVLRLGAKPLFADIDPVTYNIDPAQVAEILANHPYREKIKVILPVHLYGQCVDMPRILSLAEQYGIPVLEDAAQAIGAACPFIEDGKRVWKKAGAMGRAGCFSFFPSKNLGGIGDGGMIVTSDDQLAEDLRIIRVHGGAPKYYHGVIGGNFRLDTVQAVVLSVKLPHLPDWHNARRRNADRYNRLFEESGLVDKGMIMLPKAVYRADAGDEPDGPDYHIYNQYVIRSVDRDRLIQFLQKHDIGVEIYYPVPLHKQTCLAAMGYNELSYPESEMAAAETMALPIYPELTAEMQEYVVSQVVAFFRQ